MSKENSSAPTRRQFLEAATVSAAAMATPAIGQAKDMSASQAQLPELQVAQATTDTSSPTASDASAVGDWSRPQAMALPKEGYFKLEQGRYGPIFPRTPANYGFTIIAKVKAGREQAVRDYSKTIEAAVKADPHVLA